MASGLLRPGHSEPSKDGGLHQTGRPQIRHALPTGRHPLSRRARGTKTTVGTESGTVQETVLRTVASGEVPEVPEEAGERLENDLPVLREWKTRPSVLLYA